MGWELYFEYDRQSIGWGWESVEGSVLRANRENNFLISFYWCSRVYCLDSWDILPGLCFTPPSNVML